MTEPTIDLATKLADAILVEVIDEFTKPEPNPAPLIAAHLRRLIAAGDAMAERDWYPPSPKLRAAWDAAKRCEGGEVISSPRGNDVESGEVSDRSDRTHLVRPTPSPPPRRFVCQTCGKRYDGRCQCGTFDILKAESGQGWCPGPVVEETP